MKISTLLIFAGAQSTLSSFCDDPGYVLEWSDEFDGDTIDLSKWSPVCSGPVAPVHTIELLKYHQLRSKLMNALLASQI